MNIQVQTDILRKLKMFGQAKRPLILLSELSESLLSCLPSFGC